MNKSKIFAVVMLLAVFSSAFSVVTLTQPIQTSQAVPSSTPESNTAVSPNAYVGKPFGTKGIYAVDVTGTTITADGDLSDWENVSYETFSSIRIYIGYDADYIYVAFYWADASHDQAVGTWNKTGDLNTNHGIWAFLSGSDDIAVAGFGDDLWVWTASNRTYTGYAYECGATGTPDAGTVGFIMNTNETDTFTGAEPLYEDPDTLTLLNGDPKTYPNGTKIPAWNTEQVALAPTLSQADVVTGAAYGTGYYSVEFIRALDPEQVDDDAIDVTDNTTRFKYGVGNKKATLSMLELTPSSKYVFDTNEAAELTFDVIADEQNRAFTIRGTAYDDYTGWTLRVWCNGWATSWVTLGSTINQITGNWTYLFTFTYARMPLGEWQIFAEFNTLYDATITLNHTTTFVDNTPPLVTGMVDLGARYPDGVPIGENFTTVTVGLDDDYDINANIFGELYVIENDGLPFKVADLVEFAYNSGTFNANITIEHGLGINNTYTYFIYAWDQSDNKVTSVRYTFFAVGYPVNTIVTPAFGILAGLFGLAAAAFIIKKLKK